MGFLLLLLVAATPSAFGQDWHDEAVAACKKLNFSSKASMMRGYGNIDGYSRNSGCANECHRKTFRWDNGPQGFGDNTPPGTSTQWPSTINMASTFDVDLAQEWGVAMGEEFWGKGTNIQEGPGINIARIMRNGRNFEYISGEDPVLGAQLAPMVIKGIQQNVMAIAKHYMGNTQETARTSIDERIDEVTLMELYGPPFAAAAAHVSGIMCAYNRVNGMYACENHQTLRTMLKGYYNFTGFVVSDWGACHSTGGAIGNGLDIEMPKGNHFTQDKIQKALDSKNITMDNIDESCVRILGGYYRIPKDRRDPGPCDGGVCIKKNVSSAAHKALARKISGMSTVLLKNENGLLPLDSAKKMKIALIGPDAKTPYSGGGGSGSVHTNAVISPLTAFTARGVSVVYEEGKTTAAAVSAAKAADVAIIFGSAHSSEGHDRSDLKLGGNIDDVIEAVAAAQKNTVVVMSVPGSILTDWREKVPAILTNFLPGEQVGNAVGDVIFGDVQPSGKLPVTFPTKENEQGMTTAQYPGVNGKATYTEGLIVGYRWYDKHKVTPAYPFGHGLTYGAFSYSDLKVTGKTISFTVKRTSGKGCDTPQVYFGYPGAGADAKIPTKVLRYFKKVCDDGAVTVSYTYSDADVSNWDVSKKMWKVTKGTYALFVGSSSQAIHLTGSFTV